MYTSFFGLTEKPFTITPDPRYLYLSERHAEALAHLLYGIEDAGGFVQLTGEVGTGKTTVVRSLLGQLPAHADVALILNPRITPEEFLLAIADELNVVIPISVRHSVKSLVDQLNIFLLDAHARGRRVIVLVDEAQQLSADVLEQVRLLTNLETATKKLLQIILVGQPELRTLLARNELRQLAQRITGRYHLDPLVQRESLAYIRHRLRVAGATTDIFTPRALRELHRLSMGVPRLLNVIADRALLGAYTREVHTVTATLVRRAASEVHGRTITVADFYIGGHSNRWSKRVRSRNLLVVYRPFSAPAYCCSPSGTDRHSSATTSASPSHHSRFFKRSPRSCEHRCCTHHTLWTVEVAYRFWARARL